MEKAKVIFHQLIQDSQEFGSNDEHMVSRVFFTLNIGGKVYDGLYAVIKQSVGSDFNKDPLEVSRPVVYEGPFNYEAFRDAVEMLYRDCLSRMFGNLQNSSNIRMRNNRYTNIGAVVEFDVID